MTRLSELEKLNAVARAGNSQSSLYRLRIIFSLLSVVVFAVGFMVKSTPIEEAAVFTLATVIAVITLALFAGWRYSAPLARAFFSVCYVCYPALVLVRHTPLTWFGSGFLLLMLYGVVVGLSDLVRLLRAIWLSEDPALASERETLRRWAAELTRDDHAGANILQFTAGDFWSDGRDTFRLLQDEHWIVVADFYRGEMRKTPSLAVYDANITPILYSAEQGRLRIGHRTFRKVRLAPESAVLARELAQAVVAV